MAARADTMQVGDGTQNYVLAPWNATFTIPQFNNPFAKLVSVSWTFSASAEAQAFLVNNSDSEDSVSINGSSTVSIDQSVARISTSLPLSPSGSGIVLPQDSMRLVGLGNSSASGTIPADQLSAYIGSGNVSFPVSATDDGVFVSSTFSSVSGQELLALAGLSLTYTYAPLLPGDANYDGKVNFDDVKIVTSHFGQVADGNSSGDLNGDGVDNFADFNILANHFGRSIPATAATAREPGDIMGAAPERVSSIPEPSAMVLLLGALLGLRMRAPQ